MTPANTEVTLWKLAAIMVAVLFPFTAQAEIWKDYSPSEEVTELVVINVKPNFVDDYLVNLENTWVRGMDVLKEMGDVVNYGIWVSNVSDTPNVFLTTTFKNMGAMQGSKARYDAMTKKLEQMGMDEDEQDQTSKGYEDYREIVDYKLLRQITYN